MRNLFLFTLLTVLLTACATNMRDQFEHVKIGMDKDQVLNLMDSPQRTQRWHGKDRWTYIFYDRDTRMEKEVHFQEGVANYVGEVYKPEISAEEQDARNEATNKEVEAYAQTHQQEIRSNFQSYEQHVRGQDAIRYVPQFTPVQ